MTSGQYNGRDYGRDYGDYSAYYPDPDSYPRWEDAPSPAAGQQRYAESRAPRPGYPAGGQPAAPPPEAGYRDPGYPGAGYAGGGYADDGQVGGGHQAYPGHPGPGYQDSGYQANGYQGGNGYQDNGYQGTGYQGGAHPGAGYPDGAYPGAGYQGAGYQGAGYQGAGQQGPGYPEPGYPEPGYPAAGYRGRAYPQQRPAAPDEDQATANFRVVAPTGRAAAPYADPWDSPYADGSPARGPNGGLAGTARRDALRGDGLRARTAGGGLGDGDRGPRKRRGLPLWQEIPLLLIIAFCLAILVRTFLLQAFFIPSGSMEDTLIAGDRVLVNKVVYNFREPARGEVVVFKGTDAWAPVSADEGDIGALASVGRTLGDLVGISRPGEKDFIKRVIGLPGDTVSCCSVDGQLFVNGQPLNEAYVIRDSPLEGGSPSGNDCRSRRFDEVVVQPGHMFVMGDHRQVSQDSRCQGQVPIDNVIGRAFVIVWPNDRWNTLSQPSTFDNVPAPALAAAGPVVPADRTDPAVLAQVAFVLPILLPVGWTFHYRSARSRLIGRNQRRRLAE